MAWRFLTLLLAFAGMVAGIEGIRRAWSWWLAVPPAPTFLDWLLIGSLPLLVWMWWRHLSPFGQGLGQCLSLPLQASVGDSTGHSTPG